MTILLVHLAMAPECSAGCICSALTSFSRPVKAQQLVPAVIHRGVGIPSCIDLQM